MGTSSEQRDARVVRPDSKGRISLGKYAAGASSFTIEVLVDGALLLVPQEIPAREAWLYRNPRALESIRRGLEDARDGRTVTRGSFTSDPVDDDE